MSSDILKKIEAMISALPKLNNEPEPTTRELLELMYAGFERINGVLSTLQLGLDNLLVEVLDVKRRVVHLEVQVADVQDSLDDLSEAESKDAMASINHESRIIRLEKINNIESASLQHLAEIE
jgi:predicted  nucleic acid-binding Zn-ribbon protein